ncbi:MAG: PDZ domain-containing protein, partial [Candidatus Marinimicrobia bacterium]|nr:PDZ domain-containing protein [Candidatus Neomarinimicrobiota bacterium]
KTKGRVNRDIRTGLVGQPVDRYFQTYLGLSERRGFLITAIDEGSAGEQAGLQIGDVILEVNGRPVNSKRDFINIIDEDLVKVGDVLELTIWRAGAEVMILLKLG